MDIKEINIIVTHHCNLDCKYCFLKQKWHSEEKFDGSYTIENNLKNISNSLIKYIIITGGEPTIYKPLSFILGILKEKHFTLLTNGLIRLNDDLLTYINDIYISLDGPYSVVKFIAGSITFEKYNMIIENIKYYKNKGINVTIAQVVTLLNLNINENIDFIKNEFNCPVKIIPPSLKYTPKELQLTQINLNEIVFNCKKILKKNNYHISLYCPLTTKEQFLDSFDKNFPIQFSPEYDIETNMFYYLNHHFLTFQELEANYEQEVILTSNALIRQVQKMENHTIFDPYSIAEQL